MGASQSYNGTTTSTVVTAASAINNIWDGGGSISLWCNPNGDGENNAGRYIIKSDADDATPFTWMLYAGGDTGAVMDIKLWYGFTGADGRWDISTPQVVIGSWNHLVVTYNADSTANVPSMYLNGSSVGISTVNTPTGSRNSDSSYNLYIGNSSTGARTFDGELCLVSMYSKILTLAEINEVYHKGPGIVSSLNGYWTMMDPSGTMYDRSGNGNNGTLSNGTESFDGPPIRSA